MVVDLWEEEKLGARDKVARNGAPHAQYLQKTPLQQARRAKTRYRISHRHRLPLENPAGHRVSQRRIAKVSQLHNSPQNRQNAFAFGGVDRTPNVRLQPTKRTPLGQCTVVPLIWHGSNRAGGREGGRERGFNIASFVVCKHRWELWGLRRACSSVGPVSIAGVGLDALSSI